jgi:beta-lactamase regulating signal transducer with metallopeptidase domain
MKTPVKLLLWVAGVVIGLLVLFVVFEYVIPSLFPTSY